MFLGVGAKSLGKLQPILAFARTFATLKLMTRPFVMCCYAAARSACLDTLRTHQPALLLGNVDDLPLERRMRVLRAVVTFLDSEDQTRHV